MTRWLSTTAPVPGARRGGRRVRALVPLVALVAALLAGAGPGCGESPKTSRITVDFGKKIRVVPSFLFGQNLQTIERGEQVIAEDGALDGEIVQHLTDARISMLRFPGGTPADHFIWWQALGPPSRRALQGSGNEAELYKPVIGPEEFIELSKALRAVPFVTANIGSGSSLLAKVFAQYFNAVGFPVKFWEIGNEPYFLGINSSGVVGLTPDAYASKVIEFAAAIRSEVPDAKIFAAGVIGPADTQSYWNSVMLGIAGPYIDGISLHTYAPLYAYTPGPNPTMLPIPKQYEAMLGATKAFERTLGVVTDELTRSGRLIPIFITEYDGTFFADEDVEPADATLARNPTLACALYNASVLQVMMRSERVFGAHHMSLASRRYGSLIGVDDDAQWANPQFYVHQEYARQADHIVVEAALEPETATFDTLAVREIPAQTAVPMLDTVATRDAAGKEYALFVVNRSLLTTVRTTVTTNLPAGGTALHSLLSGPKYDSKNDAASPTRVRVTTSAWGQGGSFVTDFPPASVSIIRWTLP